MPPPYTADPLYSPHPSLSKWRYVSVADEKLNCRRLRSSKPVGANEEVRVYEKQEWRNQESVTRFRSRLIVEDRNDGRLRLRSVEKGRMCFN